MSEPKVTETKIAELIPDAANANRGTERGSAMLESSLRQYGAGRSIVVDKAGRVISGNKTLEQAGQIGLEDVIVVQTDGKKLVAVQRTDLDLADGGMARALAYADNRVGEVSLDWDPEQLLADVNAGVDLEGLFREEELAELLAGLGDITETASNDLEGAERKSLADRFVIPPFSVLDARQGYWQARKRSWLALGIKSEIGRGDVLLYEAEQVTSDGLNYDSNLAHKANATPGGSPFPAATLGKDGKTVRGDGRGRPLKNGGG